MARPSDWRQLAAAEAALEDGGPGARTADSMRRFLQLAREHACRRSPLVASVGAELLRVARLPQDERWTVHEQVVVAACDAGLHDAAAAALAPLEQRFPDSQRVARLRGMVLEARGEWDAAAAVYDGILAAAPTHEGAHKRKIAMLRSQGKLGAAAAALVEYLETFQADADAWLELADVYTCLGLYRQAAFCWQELVVAAPGAGAWHCAYAQVLATLGDADALRLAQKHYAAAVELSDGRDARALFGAVAAAGALQRLTQATGPPKKDKSDKSDSALAPGMGASDELAQLAGQRLRQLYAAHAPAKEPLAAAAVALLGAK